MEKISTEQFFGSKWGENVYVLEKKNDVLSIVADVEHWEGCIYEDDPYRVEVFCGWHNRVLNDDGILNGNCLSDAIDYLRGSNAGGICFAYETDREQPLAASSVYQALADFATPINQDDAPEYWCYQILKMSNKEFKQISELLKDGCYIIIIN